METASATALIDLDNVLSRSDPLIRGLIKHRTGVRIAEREVTQFDYSRVAPITAKEYAEILEEFHRQKSQFAEPVSGARGAMRWLSRVFKVTVATGRPREFRRQTLKWLKANRIEFDDLVVDTDKRSLADGSLFLVEDNGETALWVADRCLVYLFDYPWNAFASKRNIRRVHGWSDVLRDIRMRLKQFAPDGHGHEAFRHFPDLASCEWEPAFSRRT